MRRVTFSPRAVERLADLETTEAEFAAIREQMKALAKDPGLGYAIPFQGSAAGLHRFDVGRFGFLYRHDSRTLQVVAVIPS